MTKADHAVPSFDLIDLAAIPNKIRDRSAATYEICLFYRLNPYALISYVEGECGSMSELGSNLFLSEGFYADNPFEEWEQEFDAEMSREWRFMRTCEIYRTIEIEGCYYSDTNPRDADYGCWLEDDLDRVRLSKPLLSITEQDLLAIYQEVW